MADHSSATTQRSKRGRILPALTIAFGLFHCANLLAALLPRDSGINAFFMPYRQLTGTGQEWGMFHTIPTIQHNEITVQLRDASGSTTELGPMLPGLKPFRMRARVRHYYLMDLLTSPDKQPYFDAYVGRLGDEIRKSAGGDPVEFSIQLETDYTRLLKRIKEDRQMTLHRSETRGPFPLGQQ